MKKLKFLLIFIFGFFSLSFADESLTITTYYPSPYGVYNELTTTSNTYLATTGGNVGIGTVSPLTKLDVRGVVTITDSGTVTLVLRGNGAGTGEIVTGTNHPLTLGANGQIYETILANGNIGIGTTSPGYKLQVDWGTAGTFLGPLFLNNTADGVSGIGLGRSGQNTWGVYRYGSAGSERFGIGQIGVSEPFVITAGGNVGIGTMNPSYQLQLSTDSAAKPGTNTWAVASDIRIKKDIRPYTNGLSIIKRINPIWFKYNGKAGFLLDSQDHIGVIGQEIVKVAPYTVNTFRAKLNPGDKKETELLNFNSHALTFDLINAVKELDANISKLIQENQELKSELESLKTRLSRLEAK